MKWWSESKGAWIEAANMPGPQVANAYKKLMRGDYVPDGDPLSADEETRLGEELLAELERRGLDQNGRTVTPPPSDEDAPPHDTEGL